MPDSRWCRSALASLSRRAAAPGRLLDDAAERHAQLERHLSMADEFIAQLGGELD